MQMEVSRRLLKISDENGYFILSDYFERPDQVYDK